MAFARAMGRPIEYPFVKGIAGFPEVIESKLEHERHNFGGVWHSDTAYLDEPPMGSMLLAREIHALRRRHRVRQPVFRLRGAIGGYEAAARRALQREFVGEGRRYAHARGPSEGVRAALRVAEHPVVRTHPETGRKALYVNVGHTVRFRGSTEQESAPLLEFLFRHQVKPEFTCRFHWKVGSLAFWDNRCTQHQIQRLPRSPQGDASHHPCWRPARMEILGLSPPRKRREHALWSIGSCRTPLA